MTNGEKELEDLMDAIQSGALDDADELSDVDIDLLRRHFGDEEDLEKLIARIRTLGEER